MLGAAAGGPSFTCDDLNGYVASKDAGPTGTYVLSDANELIAAQAYHYSGEGRIRYVRVSGDVGGANWRVPVRIIIYNVDANNRPTTVRYTGSYDYYYTWNDYQDFWVNHDVDDNFAIAIEKQNSGVWEFVDFELDYTGNGDGAGEDLASLAGPSTGYNWSSAKDDFSSDGDFYLVPNMRHYMQPAFSQDLTCIDAGDAVAFTNQTLMTTGPMFNLAANPYEWDFGDGNTAQVTSGSNTYANAGGYTVVLTASFVGWNTSGCDYIATSDVSVGIDVSAINVNDASCYNEVDGSAEADASGGTGNYLYSIDGFTWQSNPVFSGLNAGSYDMWVRDDLGCEEMTSFTISEPSAISIASLNTTNANCGGTDGAILAAASGGTGTLEYSIDGTNFQTSGSFSNLAAGPYLVTVEDANGCTTSEPISVNTVSGPSLTLTSFTNASCNGATDGSIIVVASGGSGTLNYTIDDGINTPQTNTTGNFTSVAAGQYSVTVEDAAGCTDGFVQTISEPNPVNVTGLVSSNVSCNGGNDGEIEVVTTIGGTGAYSYSIDGTNFSSSTTFSGLTAGTYTLTAQDAAGCSADFSLVVEEPTALVATASGMDAGCHNTDDGMVSTAVTGGVAPYSYSIDGTNFGPTGEFDGLEQGLYQVTVVDANGCQATATAGVSAPAPITSNITTTQSTCGGSDGGFNVTGAGGNGGPFEFSMDGSTFNTTGAFTNMSAGNYFVIVQDAGGCQEDFALTISTTTGPSIDVINVTDVTCNGAEDGTMVVTTVTGGTGLLEYSVNGSPLQTSNTFGSLPAGTHTVSVIDGVGCVDIETFVITEPAAIGLTTSSTDVDCAGDMTGSITAVGAGGTGVLAYSLDGVNWQSSGSFQSIAAGSYNVSVRDAGGCTTSMVVLIDEPSALVTTYNWSDVSCDGASNGVIIINASGGTPGYQYSLDGVNWGGSNTFSNLSGGAYMAYAQDNNGCITGATVDIDEPAVLSPMGTVSNVACAGGAMV